MKKIFPSLLSLLISTQALPCTTMSYEDQQASPWVAKSFDFDSGKGYLFVNKRNVAKKSLTVTLGLRKKWVSKLASITFNQVGRDFPYGGMNEAGLNMEIMRLEHTQYPRKFGKKNQINESQIIQYILDTASTVEEAVEKIRDVSIAPIQERVHYMICDPTSRCVSVEYLNKRLVLTEMNKGKERIQQNIPYSDMLYRIRNFGISERDSKETVDFIFDNSAYPSEDAMVAKSFGNLDAVRMGDNSRWQIVYNLSTKKIWFRTTKVRLIKGIDFSNLELDCRVSSEEKVLNLDQPIEGEINQRLETFSTSINRELLDAFVGIPRFVKMAGAYHMKKYHTCVKGK